MTTRQRAINKTASKVQHFDNEIVKCSDELKNCLNNLQDPESIRLARICLSRAEKEYRIYEYILKELKYDRQRN